MPKRMSLMTLRRDLTTTLLVTLFSGTALAQESRDPSDAEEPKHALNAPSKFSDRPLMIQLRGGIDTLVGLFGLTASYDVHNRLALGAGLGTNAAGLQLAVFARVRPLIWENGRTGTLRALAFEGSFSTGPTYYRPIDFLLGSGTESGLSGTLHWSRVSWIQGEVVYEVRTMSGFSFTVGAGMAVPVDSRGPWCVDELKGWCSTNASSSPQVLPTVTGGIGYAF